jgi:cohesin loading factor subunit SCC2
MEVLKISKSKNRQRFLEKFCAQVDFDVSKLDISEELPPHVQYSRFIIENLAFFEYVTVGEVHCIVSAMEKLVTSTGANVAQAIESEVFQISMDALEQQLQPASTQPPQPQHMEIDGQPLPQTQPQPPLTETQPSLAHNDIDLPRLRQLTAGSMILLALWEVRTFLRKLYGMGVTNRRESKGGGGGKVQPKDLGKAPVKVQGVTGDKVWEELGGTIMAAGVMNERQRMVDMCRGFVELMNVDMEFLVPVE